MTFPKKTLNIVAMAVGGLVVLIAAVATITYVIVRPDPKDPKNAIPACREQVKSKMKAPATTRFPGGETVKTGVGQPEIEGVYDSENGFSALIRGSYSCMLQYDANGHPQVLSVTVNE